MISISRKIFIAIIFLLCAKELHARDVYVRLANNGSYSVGVTQGNLSMNDAEGRLANLGDSAVISVSGNSAHIGGFSFLLPVKLYCAAGFLKFNGKNYRGAFLITQRGGLLNMLDLEQYLCGVLPAEVGASWPTEALRAQAICARTYVLRASQNRAKKGFDVVDTDSDQVYKGAGVETEKTNQAVYSTAGEILTYGKEIAQTFFHSDSGGHTADIADVWGSNVPYLTGVPEVVSYKSPVSSWNATISAAKIQAAVKKITGDEIGAVSEVQVSDVDQGGRAKNITVIGARGSKTVRASQFRIALGASLLKSTMLTPSGGDFSAQNNSTPVGLVAKQTPEPAQSKKTQTQTQKKTSSSNSTLSQSEEQELAKMTSEGIFSATEIIDMLANPKKQRNYYETGKSRAARKTTTQTQKQTASSSNLKPASTSTKAPSNKYGYSIEKNGSDFIFYGRGWGHGVGMSQWGAMAMANQGYTAEKILTHYYPGTTVKKFK